MTMTMHRAHLLLLLAAALWGSGNVAQKTILEHMGPLMAVGLTSLLGAISLLPVVWHEGRRSKQVARGTWREIAVAALVFCGAIAALQIGYAGTSVSNAGFLVNTCAAMTPIAAWFILRETPTAALVPTIILVITGVWFMGGATFTELAWGDLLCLLSAVLFAISVPLVSRYVLRYGRPAQLTCVQFVVCGAICTLLGLTLEPVDAGDLLAAWPELLLVGIVSKGIAYFLMAFAQQHTSASATTILISAEAVFGAFFAALLLGEVMSGMAILGAAFILTSILILNLWPMSWQFPKRMIVTSVEIKPGVQAQGEQAL